MRLRRVRLEQRRNDRHVLRAERDAFGKRSDPVGASAAACGRLGERRPPALQWRLEGATLDTKEIERRIEESIRGAKARVEGGEAHFSALVVSGAFEGKTRIEQHRMIYALFQKEMADQAIHALALRTATPAEWERESGSQEIR